MPYDVVQFHQYGSEHPDDDLLIFAAPAKAIWRWAGIPRKGWRVRMLYQRWITENRKQEVTAFWEQASQPSEVQPKRYLVGPTALTIAILEDAVIQDGKILLDYQPPFGIEDDDAIKLRKVARVVLDRMRARLEQDDSDLLDEVEADPSADLPDVGHNYVLESLAQIAQAAVDSEYFIQKYALTEDEIQELIQSLEALCRPALVVDGQHRLFGAAQTVNSSNNAVGEQIVFYERCLQMTLFRRRAGTPSITLALTAG